MQLFCTALIKDHISQLKFPFHNHVQVIVFVIILLLRSSSHRHYLVVFHWILSYCTFRLVFRTLLSILADFNSDIIWIVSICPPIYNLFSLLSKSLRAVPSVVPIICITVTVTCHNFLCSLSRYKYLSLFSLSLIFTQWSARTTTSTTQQVLFFFPFFFLLFFFVN